MILKVMGRFLAGRAFLRREGFLLMRPPPCPPTATAVVEAGDAQFLGEIEPGLVGPVHEIAEQFRKTVLAVARRAGHVGLEGRVG